MLQKATINKLRKKEGRGKFLTTLVIFLFIGLVEDSILQLKLYLTNPRWTLNNFAGSQTIVFWWRVLFSMLIIAILIGIIQWKKKAVYALFLLQTVALFVSITLLRPILTPPLLLILSFDVLYCSLWFWAIKRKWHLFN